MHNHQQIWLNDLSRSLCTKTSSFLRVRSSQNRFQPLQSKQEETSIQIDDVKKKKKKKKKKKNIIIIIIM